MPIKSMAMHGDMRHNKKNPRGKVHLKALTIKQPWAHAILHEGKDVENRSWKRNFRGWLVIHAAGTPSREARYPRGVPMPDLKTLPYSAIVGVAYVSDIRENVKSKWFYKPARGEKKNFGWVLTKVRRLPKPIPCNGALGLWNVSPAVMRKIRKQLPSLRI